MFHTNEEINLTCLCMFLLSQGDEVLDRYDPFCLFPFVNLTLCIAITVWFLDLFRRPTDMTPSSATDSQEELLAHWYDRSNSGYNSFLVLYVGTGSGMWAVSFWRGHREFLFGVGTEGCEVVCTQIGLVI